MSQLMHKVVHDYYEQVHHSVVNQRDMMLSYYTYRALILQEISEKSM